MFNFDRIASAACAALLSLALTTVAVSAAVGPFSAGSDSLALAAAASDRADA